ncbi:MAG: HAD family hydrolase [Polyangiales bacterium]
MGSEGVESIALAIARAFDDKGTMAAAGIRGLVLDFDGTLTDADAMFDAFDRALRSRLATAVGVSIDDVWRSIAATIDAEAGWEIDGRIVAPALGDPYLRATWIARRVLPIAAPALDSEARRALLSREYSAAYAEEPPRFRPDAASVVRAACALVDRVFVVTNSPAAAVRDKLAAIDLHVSNALEVIGDARKFDITEDTSPALDRAAFEALASTRSIAGLARPIQLRRGRYLAALDRVARSVRCRFDELLVCGDIFELDLALPAALGAAIQLVTRSSTLAHERVAARAVHRGDADDRLAAVIARISTR